MVEVVSTAAGISLGVQEPVFREWVPLPTWFTEVMAAPPADWRPITWSQEYTTVVLPTAAPPKRVVAKTCRPRHVFRVGDRVRKINNGGAFTCRQVTVGSLATIMWAGTREGHYPHVLALLDKERGNDYELPELYVYDVPIELQNGTTRRRWHIAPPETFRYIGQRVNIMRIA